MKTHSNTRLLQVCLGLAGLVTVITLLTWLKGLPFRQELGHTLWYWIIVSCIFFGPPYSATFGILNLSKIEQEKVGDEFMASYKFGNTTQSKFRRHLSAVVVGVIFTFALWIYSAVVSS